MKRLFLIALALLMLLPSGAPGRAEARELSRDLSIENKAVTELLYYENFTELMQEDLAWAIGYIRAYDEDKSWEKLQIARAAVEIAYGDIEALRLPESGLSDEDLDYLYSINMDVTLFLDETVFASEKGYLLSALHNLEGSLMRSVYMRDFWELTMAYVDNISEYILLARQSAGCIADDILLTLGEDSARTLRDAMTLYCPAISATMAFGALDLDGLMAKENEIAARIDDSYQTDLRLGARQDVINDEYEAALESGDPAYFQQRAVQIEGMGAMFPEPAWQGEVLFMPGWERDGQPVDGPGPGMPIERMPDNWAYVFEGLGYADTMAYIADLIMVGFLPVYTEEDSMTYVLRQDTAMLTLRVVGDTLFVVTDGNGPAMLPALYLQARLP